MKCIISILSLLVVGIPCSAQTISDIDNNLYDTVRIGVQTWFTKNLKTTHLNDGTEIINITLQNEWSAATTPAFCWYNNDEISYKETYGALYNGFTIQTGKLCPSGWHVPTSTEWSTLINYLGGYNVAGGKLKETGTTHWQSPNNGATNEVGFTALPGGYRESDDFYGLGNSGLWWSSTKYEPTHAWSESIQSVEVGMNLTTGRYLGSGLSVRCLKGIDNIVTRIEHDEPLTLNVYPNPVSNFLRISFLTDEEKLITIFDTIGNAVISITTRSREPELDIRNFTPALYFVKVQSSSTTITFKFLKN